MKEKVNKNLELKSFEHFCEFVETCDLKNSNDILVLLRSHLLLIYTKGLQLSSNYIPDDKEYEDYITNDDIKKILQNFIVHLVNDRYYWEIFNPADSTDKEAVCGDLIDDIGDIYKDLKNSLMLYYSVNTPEAINTALWQFEFHFRTHWSDHCINALRACHYFLQKNI